MNKSQFDLDTLKQICLELSKSKQQTQTTKLLETLLKNTVQQKEYITESGLGKQITQITKSENLEHQKLAKQLLQNWKNQFLQPKTTPEQCKNTTGAQHRDKIREKFFQCLNAVGDLDEDIDKSDIEARARLISNKLEAQMARILGSQSKEYAAKSRSLLFNLQDKTNITLRLKLMAGALEPEQVINMSTHELASEAKQQEREQLKEANLQARRTDWAQEEAKASGQEGFFTCFKCGSKKTHFYQMQTRGADEPMTNFVTCFNCGKRWKC